MDPTLFFPPFTRFLHQFLLFYHKITNFGPVQLGFIADILSKVMINHYAKRHDFIKSEGLMSFSAGLFIT